MVIGYQRIWRCRWLFYPNQLVLISDWLIHLTAAYVVIFAYSRGRRNGEPSNCRVVSETLTSEYPSRHPPSAWSSLAWSTMPRCSAAGKHPGRAETRRDRRNDVAAADISECIGNDHNGQTVCEGDTGMSPPPSAVPVPAPIKINAKVPMNSVASGFVHRFISPALSCTSPALSCTSPVAASNAVAQPNSVAEACGNMSCMHRQMHDMYFAASRRGPFDRSHQTGRTIDG